MTKDYAKKRRLRRSPRPFRATPSFYRENLPTAWAWMVVGVLLGLGLAVLVYWKFRSPPTEPVMAIAGMEEEKEVERQKTDFDFYTVLPNMPVELPAPTSTVTAVTKKAAVPSTPGENYIIQVGSFRQKAQAESLKAQLALSGMEVSIQTFRMRENELWYRVYLGPFPSKQSALLSQTQLTPSLSSHSLILKISV